MTERSQRIAFGPTTTFLTLVVLASLLLHLRAEYFGPRWQIYVFKPLTTTLIIALCLAQARKGAGRYPRLIIAGLACSLAGDVFLMLPGDRFVPGLASFLAAHLCYLAAFTGDAGWRARPAWLLSYALYLLLLLVILVPRLGPLAIPVIVYGVALTAMGWQAAERWRTRGTRPAAMAAIGGALFAVSDSALALDRFVAPFAAATLVVMTTYVAAQWLIARSAEER